MPKRTVTIPGVELCRVGTWPASTGPVTFTLEDFEAAVAASQDPEVWDAPVKIGHVAPAALNTLDGYPALGWVENLRVSGDKLVGDLVDVPEPLAEVMPAAYKRRSAEMAFSVRTPKGARYKAALIGLALLGETPQAVAGLNDLDAVVGLYSGKAAAAAGQAAESTVSVVLEDPEPGGSHTIVNLPASTGAGDGSTPGGVTVPKPVSKDRLTQLLAAAGDELDDQAVTKLLEDARAEEQPGTPGQPPAQPDPGTPPAPGQPGQPGQPETPPGTPAPGTQPVPPAPGTAPATTAQLPPGFQLPEGLAVIDKGVLAQVMAGAAAGTAAAGQLAAQERETVLASHLSAGRITPDTVTAWRAHWDAEVTRTGKAEATVALLSALPASFSTAGAELGHDDPAMLAAGDTQADDQAWQAFADAVPAWRE